jgi:hypothetical protein
LRLDGESVKQVKFFVSYAGKKGKEFASKLVTKINGTPNHDAWTYNNDNYVIGDGVWDEIYPQIDDRDIMIVITNESTKDSINQKNEYTRALSKGKIVFAFVKVGVDLPSELSSRNKGVFEEASFDDACDGLTHDLEIFIKRLGSNYSEVLSNIKSDLIKISKYEKDAAIKRVVEPCSTINAINIKEDIRATVNIKVITDIVKKALVGDIDPLIRFYFQIGNILNVNNYGLEGTIDKKLYKIAEDDLEANRATLKDLSENFVVTQNNISRLRDYFFGLNSSNILKEVFKPKSFEDEKANGVMRLVLLSLEPIKAAMEKDFQYCLDNLDEQWENKLILSQTDSVIFEALFDRLSKVSDNQVRLTPSEIAQLINLTNKLPKSGDN